MVYGCECALFLSMGLRYLSCGVLNYDDIDNLPSREKPVVIGLFAIPNQHF